MQNFLIRNSRISDLFLFIYLFIYSSWKIPRFILYEISDFHLIVIVLECN